jgi:hypothetical protein
METPDLHLFKDDLLKKPHPGSNAPPISIRAKDLDENNEKLTLLKGEGDPALYDVKYTKSGTVITRILPQGNQQGDLLFWNGTEWQTLDAPQDNTLRVLAIQNGTLEWTETEDCE